MQRAEGVEGLSDKVARPGEPQANQHSAGAESIKCTKRSATK